MKRTKNKHDAARNFYKPMKTYTKNLLLLPVLIFGFGLIPAGRMSAQTFTNLHSFTIASDGGLPYAGVILSGSTLYGTTRFGGSFGNGTLFAVNTDGTGFTTLRSFTVPSDISILSGKIGRAHV